MNNRITVGQVVKCVGLKGEVKVIALTDDVNRFKRLKTVWVGMKEPLLEYTVESVRVDSKSAVVKFIGISDRSGAEELLKNFISVENEDSVTPRDGSFYAHEIIGLSVVTSKGIEIGKIEDVLKLPANDIWVVRKGVAEVLIPAVKAIIKNVDLGRQIVVIEDIEGLIELNAH
jgi:16S rRNA processing protein RimM